MNLCFSTLGCTEYSLDAILSLCNEYHISHLEMRGIGGEMNFSNMPEFQKDHIDLTKEKFQKANVKPYILGTSCSFHTEEKYQKAMVEGELALQYAKEINAMGIRVFGNNLTEDPQKATSLVIDGLHALCNKANSTNVKVLLEVHGDFNTIETLSPILEALKEEKHFGLIWDIAHSHRPYGDQWMDFYKVIKPFVCHVHIKDANKDGLTLPGDGDIPILPIVKQLIKDGYTGAFSLEWEKKWHPELPAMETALDKYISLMQQV